MRADTSESESRRMTPRVWNQIKEFIEDVTRQGASFSARVGGSVEQEGVLLLLVAELVTDAPDSQDHLRNFRVLFNLGTEPVDV